MRSTPARTSLAFAALACGALVACGSTSEPRAAFYDDARLYQTAYESTELDADALLAARLKMALDADPMTRGAAIHITVRQGRARLSGFVPNAAAKLRAADLVQRIEGVTTVENRLILRYHAGVSSDPLADARVYL